MRRHYATCAVVLWRELFPLNGWHSCPDVEAAIFTPKQRRNEGVKKNKNKNMLNETSPYLLCLQVLESLYSLVLVLG